MFLCEYKRNILYKPNIYKAVIWMDKPFGLEKIYLFPSPFPKTFFESQSWMKQADKSDTETPGISKKCPHKKLSPRYSAHNTTVKLNWKRADPQMTRKYISYQSCDIPYCHYQSLYREHFKLSPLQLLYLKERGYSWKQAWEFRQV